MGEADEDAEKGTPVLKEEESLLWSILFEKNYLAETSDYLSKPFRTSWNKFWKIQDAGLYFCGCFFPFLAVFVALLVPFIGVLALVSILWLLGILVEFVHQIHVG